MRSQPNIKWRHKCVMKTRYSQFITSFSIWRGCRYINICVSVQQMSHSSDHSLLLSYFFVILSWPLGKIAQSVLRCIEMLDFCSSVTSAPLNVVTLCKSNGQKIRNQENMWLSRALANKIAYPFGFNTFYGSVSLFFTAASSEFSSLLPTLQRALNSCTENKR